jgi:hypothetical protein
LTTAFKLFLAPLGQVFVTGEDGNGRLVDVHRGGAVPTYALLQVRPRNVGPSFFALMF